MKASPALFLAVLLVGCAGGYVASAHTSTALAQSGTTYEHSLACRSNSNRVMDDTNAAASQGWRAVNFVRGEHGGICVLMERAR